MITTTDINLALNLFRMKKRPLFRLHREMCRIYCRDAVSSLVDPEMVEKMSEVDLFRHMEYHLNNSRDYWSIDTPESLKKAARDRNINRSIGAYACAAVYWHELKKRWGG